MEKLDSSRTRINYIRVNEVINKIIILMTLPKILLLFNLLFSSYKEMFFKTYINLVNYTFVNRIETFIIFSQPDNSKFQKLLN